MHFCLRVFYQRLWLHVKMSLGRKHCLHSWLAGRYLAQQSLPLVYECVSEWVNVTSVCRLEKLHECHPFNSLRRTYSYINGGAMQHLVWILSQCKQMETACCSNINTLQWGEKKQMKQIGMIKCLERRVQHGLFFNENREWNFNNWSTDRAFTGLVWIQRIRNQGAWKHRFGPILIHNKNERQFSHTLLEYFHSQLLYMYLVTTSQFDIIQYWQAINWEALPIRYCCGRDTEWEDFASDPHK